MALARDFHCRCDCHAPTLALSQDRRGNFFGGFTPVKWESCDKSEGFCFSHENPHNLPARKCALNAEMKHQAVDFSSSFGPGFDGGSDCDVSVSGNCNANESDTHGFGCSYANDTGWRTKLNDAVGERQLRDWSRNAIFLRIGLFLGEDLDTGNPTAVRITSSTIRETVFHGIAIEFAYNLDSLCGIHSPSGAIIFIACHHLVTLYAKRKFCL
jgi:hypothetical protein